MWLALDELVNKKLAEQRRESQRLQDTVLPTLGQETNWMDGVGEMKMRIDANAFHDLARVHGGYEIFSQPDWQRWFLKRAPECKVISKSPKIQVGYRLAMVERPGLRESIPIRPEVRGQKSEGSLKPPLTADLRPLTSAKEAHAR